MNHRAKTSAGLLAAILLGAATGRAVANSPYAGIPERNVFALVPVVPKPEKIVEPSPNIVLTGVTTILGTKHALFTVQFPNQPLESCILSEGQTQAGVEVVQIEEMSGRVQLKFRDTIQTLDFKTNGAKSDPKAVNLAATTTPRVLNPQRTMPHPPPMPIR